jgi:flagellar biosynthetic protein FliR
MFNIDVQTLLTAAYCFIRVGGVIFSLPLFGESTVPMRVRLFLTIAISYCIFPTISPSWTPAFRDDALWFAISILRELMIGLVIGFSAKLMFEGIILAANLVGYQMGFGTGSLLLGDAEAEMTSFTALHRIMVTMVFFSLSLHHSFITSLASTFELIPAGAAFPNQNLTTIMISATAAIFKTAIQLAAPIFVAMLFTTAALGLIARTVPQLNVFTLSFPISFFIGLGVYIASTPYLNQWIHEHFSTMEEVLMTSIVGLTTK